jgi:pimeloyl-ACP methyl ester carboxylesterase
MPVLTGSNRISLDIKIHYRLDFCSSNYGGPANGAFQKRRIKQNREVGKNDFLPRRDVLKGGIALAGALGVGLGITSAAAPSGSSPTPRSSPPPAPAQGPLDASSEAKKIAFDRIGNGEKVLLISGFPQTRISWSRLTPLLSHKFQAIPADLPSFGDSGILSAPATTENVGRVFHEFVANLGVPLHVVAHDFGAWCAYSWALLFPEDFKSLTLIEAGIPGITLLNEIQLSDYKRKWNFIFMMLPDLPAELINGKEDIYVGWWYKNKVHKPGAVPPDAVAAYVRAVGASRAVRHPPELRSTAARTYPITLPY